MTGRRLVALVAAGVVLTTVAAAPSGGAATPPTVSTGNAAALGAVLVDARGITLYRNTQEHGANIACTAGCAMTWPPLVRTGGALTLARGMTGKLATITRPDGRVQVTYNGIPLYRYAGDSKRGQATGQGVGGVWFVTRPGQRVAAAPPTTTSPASHGGTDYYP